MAERGPSPDDTEGNDGMDQDIPMSIQCSDQSNDHAAPAQSTSGFLPLSSITEENKPDAFVDKIKLSVGPVNTTIRKHLEFSRSATIYDLVARIKGEFEAKKEDEISVYAPVRIGGSISEPKSGTIRLEQYKELVFHVKGTAITVETIAELKSTICEQNIVCLGAPRHGKSSFINTVLRAFGKQPGAPTFRGTEVYSPYRIEIEEKTFTLWDVPGAAVKGVQEDQLQSTVENILKGKQQPNVKIEIETQSSETKNLKIHAVLAVQNGQVETDKMHDDFMTVANRIGRAIPVFMIMTHIDKMNQWKVETQKDTISRNLGINAGDIFPIANYTGGESEMCNEDPQRDFYVRKFLLKVLGASKSYMENTTEQSSDIPDAVSDKINLFVGPVNTKSKKPLQFSRSATIYELVARIKCEFEAKKEDEISVYAPVRIGGSISEPIPGTTRLEQYDNKELVFHVEGTALNVESIAKLKSNICEQNIACLGAPGHGKSSFINTVLRALGKETSAPTFIGEVSGTKVYSPYTIEVEEKKFTLWDVPGDAFKAVEEDKLQRTIENILKGKQQANVKIEMGTQWSETKNQQIHAVLAVQNGLVETDKMHVHFMAVANSSGRAIPVFMIMTHIDKMDQGKVETQKDTISRNLGINAGDIFPIANYTGGDSDMCNEDPQRDFYVRKCLQKVLGASKSYMENTTEQSLCIVA